MKRCLIILILLNGLFNWAYGQSAIDSLIKYRVIMPKQRPVLEKAIKEEVGVSYNVAILSGLNYIIIQKTFHIDPHNTGLFYSYMYENLNKKSQDSINTSLRLLLDKINKSGLLTDRVYNETLKDIDSSRYLAEVQMISNLAGMSSRLEWLAQSKLLPVAEQLHKNGIVSDSAFRQLEYDTEKGKIESSVQLISYCNLAGTFDMPKDGDDPGLWLEQLHRSIASMLPGLNFTDFSYTESPDSASSLKNMPEIKFKVRLNCKGHIYKYSNTAFRFKNRMGKVHFSFIAPDFYRIFNKILADEGSSYRLHSVMFGRASGDNFDHIYLIALTEDEAQILMEQPCLSYMSVSMENYDNTLTSSKIDSTIAECKHIGLFAHLSETEIKKATDNAETADSFSIDNLLSNFPQVTYSLFSSTTSKDHLYVTLLSNFASITHGAFNPTKISQRKLKDGVKLQYLTQGKMHSYIFKTANGWMDDRFPKFMKGLSQENNLQGNFYNLPYEDAVIYLTGEQYKYISSHKLLVLDEPIPEKTH